MVAFLLPILSWLPVVGATELGWIEGEGVAFALGRRGFALSAIHMRPAREEEGGRAFLRLSSRVFRIVEPTWREVARGSIELSARLVDLRGDGSGEDGASGVLMARIERGAEADGAGRLQGDLSVGERRWRLLATVRCEAPRREGPAGGRPSALPATEDRARRGPIGPPRGP